jgi:flagellar basal-body rod modification protein FlgD
MSDIYVNSYTGERATSRGTRIIKAGEDMDKNAFLKILSAELSNLDPTANNDSTQYVTQMAQFSSMEQMTNLNNTMSNSAAYNLVGKAVTVNSYDSQGVPYTGVVQGVSGTNGNYTLSVQVNENGENVYKDFPLNSIMTVLQVPDYSIPPLNSMNGNIAMMVSSSYIGKYVELSEANEAGSNYTGKVLGVSKKNGEVFVKVKIDGSDEIKEFTYDKIFKVSGEL